MRWFYVARYSARVVSSSAAEANLVCVTISLMRPFVASRVITYPFVAGRCSERRSRFALTPLAIATAAIDMPASHGRPLTVVQQPMQPMQQTHLRTGTDKLPTPNQVASSAHGGHRPTVTVQPQPSYEGLNTPSVWRSARTHAGAKVDALASNGMDEIEIPALLRKAGRLKSACVRLNESPPYAGFPLFQATAFGQKR